MSDPSHPRLLHRFRIALLVALVFVVPLAVLSIGYFRRQAAVFRQQADIEAIRRRGGMAVLGPSDGSVLPPLAAMAGDVSIVDLSNANVDAELMQTISRFTAIERLTLDGAKLRPEDYELLGKIPRLRSLSLSRTNVTDTNVSRLPLGLTSLSLNGTSVTDKSISRLAAMNGLVRLDITDTEITPDGLRLLEPLRSLDELRIADSCITAESVESLRLMQLQVVEVAVLEGMGRQTHELLSVCDGPKISGRHPDDHVLWEAHSAWSDTLAGVVEAVVSEIGLDSQQAAQLLEALGDQGGWEPIMLGTPPPASWFGYPSNLPDRGIEIESVDEFVRELQKRSCDLWAVRRFGRENFTAGDVPKLLAAIRRAQFSEARHLFEYGPFLLVHHGFDNPEVISELDRLLAHEDPNVRGATLCAFGFGGARRYYSREEWAASKEADAFAVPRMLRICSDEREPEGVREVARRILADIAHSRPEYVAEVMPVLVDLLDEKGPWHSAKRHISRVDISRLAEVDTDAAIAVVPRLREMLKQLDEQLVDAPEASPEVFYSSRAIRPPRISVLKALAATAHHSPALAHEIALQYLSRMRDEQPTGPFAPLLSADTPEANRMVVIQLLRNTNVAKGELASVARAIRDWRTAKEQGKQ